MDFGPGDSIIVQGDDGEDMFFLDTGNAAAKFSKSSSRRCVADRCRVESGGGGSRAMAASEELSTDWLRSAGDFECVVCKRTRLPASEFSNKQASPLAELQLRHKTIGSLL